MPVIMLSVEIGKYGRIVLPKELRDKWKTVEDPDFLARG